jgi:hypothetical protein
LVGWNRGFRKSMVFICVTCMKLPVPGVADGTLEVGWRAVPALGGFLGGQLGLLLFLLSFILFGWKLASNELHSVIDQEVSQAYWIVGRSLNSISFEIAWL